MVTNGIDGKTALARLRRRYETTETKCPECGFVDDNGNWTSRTDGRQIVYHHVCPSCGADREHVFTLNG
ncbi:MAG: HVO_0649 family zinc finger protein [Halobacteriales archaeon]